MSHLSILEDPGKVGCSPLRKDICSVYLEMECKDSYAGKSFLRGSLPQASEPPQERDVSFINDIP